MTSDIAVFVAPDVGKTATYPTESRISGRRQRRAGSVAHRRTMSYARTTYMVVAALLALNGMPLMGDTRLVGALVRTAECCGSANDSDVYEDWLAA